MRVPLHPSWLVGILGTCQFSRSTTFITTRWLSLLFKSRILHQTGPFIQLICNSLYCLLEHQFGQAAIMATKAFHVRCKLKFRPTS